MVAGAPMTWDPCGSSSPALWTGGAGGADLTLHCTEPGALHCTVLHCTALHLTATLHCTALALALALAVHCSTGAADGGGYLPGLSFVCCVRCMHTAQCRVVLCCVQCESFQCLTLALASDSNLCHVLVLNLGISFVTIRNVLSMFIRN